MSTPAPDPLAEAQATERALREQVNELASARVRAEREATRLDQRAALPGAEPLLSELAGRYRAQAERLSREVEEARRGLRQQEARVEELRAPPAEEG